MGQLLGLWRGEGERGTEEEEEKPNTENGINDTLNTEDEDLSVLRALSMTGQTELFNGAYDDADRHFREGITLAANLHIVEPHFKQEKLLLWMELHRSLSDLKRLQGRVIQSMEEMQKAIRLSEYNHSGLIDALSSCLEEFNRWSVSDCDISKNRKALRKYVTRTCPVAETCHRQGNRRGVECETLPLIAVLEVLQRAGDHTFATEDKLRHAYFINGLALCNMNMHGAENCSKRASHYGGNEDLEALQLPLSVNQKKDDISKVLSNATDGANISPETTANCGYLPKKKSGTPKKKQCAVKRKKRKLKLKSYPRRGHGAVDVTITGSDDLFASCSVDKFKVSVSRATGASTENAKHAADSPSAKAFEMISKRYKIRLACDECATEKERFTDHKCKEQQLLLQKKSQSVCQKDWIHVRTRPPTWDVSDVLCDCTEQECAVKRKKRKLKLKSYPRRGHGAVDVTITGSDDLFASCSVDKFKVSVSRATGASTENAKHAADSPSAKAFEMISKRYKIRLACDECATEKERFTDHKCKEQQLLLQKKSQSVCQKDWIHVRARPPTWDVSDVLCDCTEQECKRPHNAYEGDLWRSNVDIWAVVRDMRICPLVRTMYIVSKLTFDQQYVFVCKTCFDKDPDEPVTKAPHQPSCKRGHTWRNLICRLETVTNDAKTYSEPPIDDVVIADDLVKECVRSKQRKISGRNRLGNSSKTSTKKELVPPTGFSSNFETDITTGMMDNFCDDDILTRDDEDDDNLHIIPQHGEIYYDIYNERRIGELLSCKPDRYKRFTIRLTGMHGAVCTPEIVAGNTSKINIKGRMNCGPTFDGDDIVLKLIETKELDTGLTGLSGRVVRVLGGCVKRRSHMFVCNVDEYSSCLMVPRGTAPKFHIIDSYLTEKYKKRRKLLVSVCKKTDGRFQHKRIYKIPKDRQSKLFVVRYIHWKTTSIYPLGCVVKVIDPGIDLPSGQRILNLHSQIQQHFPTEVISRAEKLCEQDMPNGRCDLREEYTFTIDPQGCKDIDDAFSIRRLERHAGYEIYVHIADVTHYVKPSDPVDLEARRRGTTFYPEVGCSAFHMLPEKLCENRCSLLSGEDRLALSVRLTLDNDGNIVEPSPTVARTVINVDAQLTYTDVGKLTLSSTGENDTDRVAMQEMLPFTAEKETEKQDMSTREKEMEELGKHEMLSFTARHEIEELDIKDTLFSAAGNKSELGVQKILMSSGENGSKERRVQETLTSTGETETEEVVVQKMLRNKIENLDADLCIRLTWLHDLSQRRRQTRLHDNRFHSEYDRLFEDDDHAIEAHYMVEEFMFLANKEVAKFLVGKFPEDTPLRRQVDPTDDDLRSWQTKNAAVARRTFYFQLFKELLPECDERETAYFTLLPDTARELKQAVDDGDVARATTLVSSEQLHPEFALLFPSWYDIQQKSEYTRSSRRKSCRHFTLREDVYTHFTSPIRRYFDIVVHRLIKAAIDGQPSPYTGDEIDEMCRHLNYKTEQQIHYQNDLKSLKAACSLNSAQLFLPGVVEDIGAGHFRVYFPHLRLRKDVKYGHLGVRGAQTAESDNVSLPNNVTLFWRRKVFDTRGCPSHQRSNHTVNTSLRLATDAHIVRVLSDEWKDVQRAIIASDTESLLPVIRNMMSNAQSSSNELAPDVTSEMKAGEQLWRKACDFELSLKRNDTVMFQVGADLLRGLLQPTLRLMNLTRQLDLCIDHMAQPVKCFADTAVLHRQNKYTSIEEYQGIWLPMLAMEAAEHAVKEGDPTVVHNVKVLFQSDGNKLRGSFTLHEAFCKTRQIALIVIFKQDVVTTDCYLCIRCETIPEAESERRSRHLWICHALTHNACVINDGTEIEVEFLVHRSTNDPPQILQNTNGASCTVELMPKMNTDKRKEDAVRDLKKASQLSKAIALARSCPISDPELLCPENLQIETLGSSTLKYLPHSNCQQLKAIRSGLTSNFTVIQGPPGTGKTQTVVKLAFWFVEMNRKRYINQNRESRQQVLYCGPSNGAVDVAAKLIQGCFGEKAPKILRIYSEELERQVFPIPRESPVRVGHGRRFELIDSNSEEKIGLHYLIRKPGNTFSTKILEYDRLFSNNINSHYNVDDDEIEKYSKLITDAAIHEIPQYDILLCTCSHSASPRIKRAANVIQCIIDECGMCTEPETLIPLTSHKPQQVVLIGDHKQLRPIVKQPTAKDLGLDISLFERYEEKAIMLDMQYRMHPAICDFPSQQFYGGLLITAENYKARLNFISYPKGSKEKLQTMWPNRARPLVFCHVEGAEKSLVISSSDGNEASKSNLAERDHAVRIFVYLVNACRVPQDKVTVLSQYRAQCSEISRALEEVHGFIRPNVSTVVASQGNEWDYVIMSTVRSVPQHEIDKRPSIGWMKVNLGFIMDANQINVGLTRARMGLIIIGNKHLLRCSDMWRQLLVDYQANGCLLDAADFLTRAPLLNEER